MLLTSTLGTLVQAQTDFQVDFMPDTPNTQIELGKPLWLELSTNQLTPSLKTIDFSELGKHFHIDKSLPINIDPKLSRQSWRLRLYAYRTGIKTIPPLLYAQARSTALDIEIKDAIDPKTNTPIKLQTYVSHDENHPAWVREQILVRYTLLTKTAYSQFQVPDETQPGMEIRAFKLEVQPRNVQQYQYTLGWSIHALHAGAPQLSLPPLQFINDGVPTHHFYPPPLALNIKALPIYVPATMPVGQLHVSVPNTWQFTFSQRLAQFPLIISGRGMPFNQLPAINNEIQSTTSLRTYPTRAQTQDRFTADGMQSSARYQVAYKPIAQGVLSLPPIWLNYFDPNSATVQTLELDSVRIISANPWLVVLVASIVLYLIYRVGAVLLRFIKRKTRQIRYYYLALQRLPKANSAEEIRACMTLVAHAEAWPENLSVNQWLQRMWVGRIQHRQKLGEKLNQYCYQARARFEISKLQRELRELCVRRHPLLKLFN